MNYDRSLLEDGQDVRLSLGGKDNTILIMKNPAYTRPEVYKLLNEGDFVSGLQKMGFKQVVFKGAVGAQLVKGVGEAVEARLEEELEKIDEDDEK